MQLSTQNFILWVINLSMTCWWVCGVISLGIWTKFWLRASIYSWGGSHSTSSWPQGWTSRPNESDILCSQYSHNIYCMKWSEVAQSCPTLCDPMDCSPPGSSIHGIFQARVLEWVAISFSRRSSQPRNWTRVSRIVGRRSTIWATAAAAANLLQSCLTLCNPIDGSLPVSPVPGILQARTLEWVAISFSRRSSQPRDWTLVSRIVGRRSTIWATREVSLLHG